MNRLGVNHPFVSERANKLVSTLELMSRVACGTPQQTVEQLLNLQGQVAPFIQQCYMS